MNYSDLVIDHFEHPRNVVSACAEGTMSGRAGSKASGAMVEFCLEVRDSQIDHAGFRAWGCPYTIAVASWLTEQLPGQRLEQVRTLDLNAIASELGLPAEKWQCVLTAEDALRDAMKEELL